MVRINIKALSVNQAYKGRKFSTPALRQYKKDLDFLLPKMKIDWECLEVNYIFGVSSRQSDGDNLVKAFQDCLSEKYGFNDNQIYKWTITKQIVPKGKEFVDFEIKMC